MEIEATQNLNTRAKGDKTYHLVVSFRDEKPSPEALKDIEEQYAKALGFEDHQRVVATHQNTDNFHMHVAYNKIHPDTLKILTPGRDFFKLENVSREMEKKYGLAVDLGPADKKSVEKISSKARDYEAVTWEQSFENYVKENKTTLTHTLSHASNWQDLHNGFAEFDLLIKKRGNGLVITTGNRKTGIKASSLDRTFAKKPLEEKLGSYQPPEKQKINKPKKKYSKKPITKYSKQSAAWNRYIGKKRSKESLAIRAFKNWREFLVAEAMYDPLAMAIMNYHKQLLNLPGKVLDNLKKPKQVDKPIER